MTRWANRQFGKNHVGDRDEHLPAVHGFDEFYIPQRPKPHALRVVGPEGGPRPAHARQRPRCACPSCSISVPILSSAATFTPVTYYDWPADHVFLQVPARAYVGEFLATFGEYPQRQKAATFNLDEVLRRMQESRHDNTIAQMNGPPRRRRAGCRRGGPCRLR